MILSLTRGPSASVAWRSEPRLAVLPFELLNMPPEMQHLSVSLADAVITRISASRKIRVRPTAAVLSFEDTLGVDLQDVGRSLRVDYVLSGTVQRFDQKDHVALTLIRAADGVRTWSGTLTAHADDLQQLERMVAARVMAALDAKPAAGLDRPRTQNAAAYEAYLLGRFCLARFTSRDTLAAVTAFERALAEDSKFALAHAGLAMASAQMYIRFGSQADIATWKTRAERHATRALELERTLAEAHQALAAVARYTEVDWDRAIEQSLAAVRLNPSLDLPRYYLASALQHIGRLDLVEEQIASGLEANPMNLAEAFRLRGVTALWDGRFSEAQTYLERVRELAAKPVSDPHLAQALYYGGDAQSAEAMLAELGGGAQAEQRAGALWASFLAARGERQQARALAEKVLAGGYRDHHAAYRLGATYAGLGEPSSALHWLREAARTGFLCHPWYVQDPLLAPLHQHPEFPSFVARVKHDGDRIFGNLVDDLTRDRSSIRLQGR